MAEEKRTTESRFVTLLQPSRDMDMDWRVDVGKQLERYLEKLKATGLIDDGKNSPLNFAEGLKKEEVKVELVDNNTLQISGKRSKEEEKKGDRWHTVKHSHGKFLRKFKLPGYAKIDAVIAKVENSVLTITVPKTEAKKPERRSITVA